jgi:hypothetical protein
MEKEITLDITKRKPKTKLGLQIFMEIIIESSFSATCKTNQKETKQNKEIKVKG